MRDHSNLGGTKDIALPLTMSSRDLLHYGTMMDTSLRTSRCYGLAGRLLEGYSLGRSYREQKT